MKQLEEEEEEEENRERKWLQMCKLTVSERPSWTDFWSIVVLWNKLGSLWLGRFTSFGDIADIRRKTSQNTNKIQDKQTNQQIK